MTIKQIAELAGVSTATVSYAINDSRQVAPETKKRVLEIVEQSGYRPNGIAKSLRVKQTHTIGVLVEDIRAFPVPPVINGISEYAEQNKYQILLYDLHMLESLLNRYYQIATQKKKINDTISWLLYGARVDAIIYVGMFDRDISGIFEKIEKPLVVSYSLTADEWNRSVTYDSINISAALTRYLLEAGHEKIGVITGLEDTYPSRMRLDGVRQAFSEAGLSLDDALIKNGDWEYQSGYDCMRALLSADERPTAVFAMNDIMAAGAMDAITDGGLSIPADISVVGFDNRELSYYLHPRLTTVNIDLKGIGLKAAQVAIDMINKSDDGDAVLTLPCELVLRESVRRK